MTLTEFVAARLDEDEAIAREASPHDEGHWIHEGGDIGHVGNSPMNTAIDLWNTPAGPHIARHDPARVLAEVAAKRAIVALYDGPLLASDDCWWEGLFDALTFIAAVDADHPDFDPEWARSASFLPTGKDHRERGRG